MLAFFPPPVSAIRGVNEVKLGGVLCNTSVSSRCVELGFSENNELFPWDIHRKTDQNLCLFAPGYEAWSDILSTVFF